MIGAILAAFAIAQVEPFADRPFPARVPVVFEITEEVEADELIALRRIEAVRPRVVPSSNMVKESVLDAVARFPAAEVVLSPPLRRAHVEQFDRRPSVGAIVDLGETAVDEELVARLQRLGPRKVTIRADRIDPAREAALARLGSVVIELDVRGREPKASELEPLRRLYRAARAVRVDTAMQPDAVRGLAALRPLSVVVVAREAALPLALSKALRELDAPVRVRFDRLPTVAEVAGAIAGLRAAVELSPTNGEELEPRAVSLVRALGPPGEPEPYRP